MILFFVVAIFTKHFLELSRYEYANEQVDDVIQFSSIFHRTVLFVMKIFILFNWINPV